MSPGDPPSVPSSDPVAQADALLARGRKADAVALVGRAADGGDAAAAFRLAIWRLVGDPVPRDLPLARALLRRAAAAGHHEAQLVEVALVANGSGGIADWAGARALLDAAAPDNPGAALQRDLIARMAVDADGMPMRAPDVLPMTPDRAIRHLPAFFTQEECTHVARASADLLEAAFVVDPRTGRNVPHPVRTSDAAVIGPVREDLVIATLNRRIAAATGTDVRQGEALTVLRYRPGQQFRMHSDALPHTANQRVTTVLVYLNQGFGGGETVFPDYDVSVTPKAGDAIAFANTGGDGRPEPRARHAGIPVSHGVKWIASRWIRARPFDIWTGPEAAAAGRS